MLFVYDTTFDELKKKVEMARIEFPELSVVAGVRREDRFYLLPI